MTHYRIWWHKHGLLPPDWSTKDGRSVSEFPTIDAAHSYAAYTDWPYTIIEYPDGGTEIDGRVIGYWRPSEGWREWPYNEVTHENT